MELECEREREQRKECRSARSDLPGWKPARLPAQCHGCQHTDVLPGWKPALLRFLSRVAL
jgi:hypothetical protein